MAAEDLEAGGMERFLVFPQLTEWLGMVQHLAAAD